MANDLCRDWLTTLWRASFKGVPFYFEQDKEEGGRGLVVHEFPYRDDPFVEDMGEAPRTYSGSAYVHGDDADSLANALKAALASRGAGTLVVPYFGPVTVHCQTFERSTQRDQLGYVAFELKFVRKGASTAFVSVPVLQNVAFQAADDMARQLGTLFPRSISIAAQPDYVVAAVTDTLGAAAGLVDVMRKTYPTDPAISAQLRDRVAAFVGALADSINSAKPAPAAVTAQAAELIAIVRLFGDALPAEQAVRAMHEFADAFADPSASVIDGSAPQGLVLAAAPYLTTSAVAINAASASRLARLAAITAYAEATLRRTFSSRPDGVTARGEIAERFELETLDTTGAENAALYVAILDLRGRVIEWLSRTINDLAPVITVESAIIRPSLALAYDLYADATRSDELVARNSVRHPSFMPRTITALSR